MPRGGARVGAGRPRKNPVSFETRKRIQKEINADQIIARLNQFIQGEIKMSSPAVTAALGLLRKIMPDLAAVAHSGNLTIKPANELSDDQLAGIAAASGNRTAETPQDQAQFH